MKKESTKRYISGVNSDLNFLRRSERQVKVYLVRRDIHAEIKKCGSCNFPTCDFYVLADSQEEAEELFKDGDAGMCGACFTNWIMQENYEVHGELSMRDIQSQKLIQML